ncbi:MAG: hypothetical protein ABIB46_00945 [bacterium]
MRKIVNLFVICFLIFSMTTFAKGYFFTKDERNDISSIETFEYFSAGFGASPKPNTYNLILELGKFSTTKKHNRSLIAIDYKFIYPLNNNIPFDTYKYPCPNSNYTKIGTKQDNEQILLGKYSLGSIKNKNIFIFALGGLSVSREINLTKSNITKYYYEQSSNSKINLIFGIGISSFSIKNKMFFSLEYDNRQGISCSMNFFPFLKSKPM